MKRYLVFLYLFIVGFQLSFSQSQKEYSSSEIYKKIQKLNFLGSVLYVGAHPDDENTALISYMSNKTNARVAYLSMTRGDGGQNLIGSEIRELLGVIRTQELLEARKVDGGEQFFTRANDFGFSKNPTETFEFWDKDKVLSDVVWTFRNFRPDIIIDRFNHRTEGDTHGHHTASARLSVEAFDLAGKKDKYANQLEYTEPWQPRRLYFNDSWFLHGSKEKYQEADHEGFTELDLGEYLPIIGLSNTEISALSRSQHRSQGFGQAGERGGEKNYSEPIKGDFDKNNKSFFAGIDTSWNRVKGGKEIGKILNKVKKDFAFDRPEKSLSGLLKAYKKIQDLDDAYWRDLKTGEIKEIIAAVSGLYLETSTKDEFGTLGQELNVDIEAINRSSADVYLKNVSFSSAKDIDFEFNQNLESNKDLLEEKSFTVPGDLKYSSPYWLRENHSLGMYTVDNQNLIGLPETPAQLVATFHLTLNDIPIDFDRELIYKTTSQTEGEIKEPFSVVPNASVAMHDKVLVFAKDSTREVKVDVRAYKDDASGTLRLKFPKGWEVAPAKMDVDLKHKGDKETFSFQLTPPNLEDEGYIQPEFTVAGTKFTNELHVIDYDHIETQTVLLPSKTKVNRLDIKTEGKNIAYIPGSGDEMPTSLEEIGYKVTILSSDNLSLEKLQGYDAVVLGIRIYNLDDNVIRNQNVLFNYVKEGGTLVTQYSQLNGIKTKNIAPYDLNLTSKRVTDEESDVKFLVPEHPVVNTPNKITEKDFEGWVQERGLYFSDEWDEEFTPIFGMNDKEEDELQGSLLVSRYGKGHFIYTGLSFFRQLPAGVPGAYRLFANILAL